MSTIIFAFSSSPSQITLARDLDSIVPFARSRYPVAFRNASNRLIVRHLPRTWTAFLLGLVIAALQTELAHPQAPAAQAPESQSSTSQTKKRPLGPPAPQSTHFPILLLAFGSAVGNTPNWSIRIGQKGPERLDRDAYPPAFLEPIDVSREGTNDAWTYRAKDSATGAEVTVHLTREPCTADASGTKYAFHASAQHAQLGAMEGCARIATEMFPKVNNQPDEDEDDDKKTPPVIPADVIKFQLPTAVAYVAPSGKVVLALGSVKRIAATEGSDLCVSHDGKKLLYTRSDSKTGPERSIVLYDSAAARSQDLIRGNGRQAFWSPDDSRVAFLSYIDQKWQLAVFPSGSPAQPTVLYNGSLMALQGWTDPHTLLAADTTSAYWIQDDGHVLQTVPLSEIYGDEFDIASSDSLRVNPGNPDLLLVSAAFTKAPEGSAKDAKGLASGFFFYELRSKRRTVISPADQWARHAEWSRDAVQIFYTRRISATSSATYRMLWDTTNMKRYVEGTDFVIGK